MRITNLAICLFLIFIFVAMGCSSGGSDNITSPGDVKEATIPTADGNSSTGLWGVWEISINKNTGDFELTRLREADLALNVVGFLEPPALVNLTIDFDTLSIDLDNNYVGVDVTFTHPFVTPENIFNGFDVRGIVFGPWVDNSDGLTRYFNPNDFTGTPFGYQDGLLGAPDQFANYQELFNGYKYFADGIGLNEDMTTYFTDPGNETNRGMFSEGNSISRHYDLLFGGGYSDFMVFNYAVFASYNWPLGDPPFVLDDFEITTSNQAEPVFAEIVENANSLYYDEGSDSGGGNIDLDITIFDWVKPVNPEEIWIEVPGGILDATQATFVSDVDAYRRLYTVSAAATPLTSADLDIIVKVTTEKTYGDNYFMDLMPISHPLYDSFIETQFAHSAEVFQGVSSWSWVDPMDTSTESFWTIEHGPGHSSGIDWAQAGTEWQSNGGQGPGGQYGNYMDTYLVSPVITGPDSGTFSLILTHKYYTETNYDEGNIYYRYEGQGWNSSSINPQLFEGQSSGWPNGYVDDVYTVNLTPSSNFQLGFHFDTDLSITYAGWFLDHLILTENTPPVVSTIDGPSIVGDFGSENYSVQATDPDVLTYSWSNETTGNPPLFDDPGNGDGTIDINWTTNGFYTLVCKVTDNGTPNLSTTSAPLDVIVDDSLPNTPGPGTDFETWPPTGWTFNDHTIAGTGEFWGQTSALGTNCLDADGADDSCYGDVLFEEARWSNVTVPSSANAVMLITHTIWSEGSTSDYSYFYDGGMLFIDDTLIDNSDYMYGYENSRYQSSAYWWTPNTYLPVWPGSSIYYGWSNRYPDPNNWLNGFTYTIMDISSYADGGQHDFSFIFHADSVVSCSTGSSYHTWLIDKVEIFYD